MDTIKMKHYKQRLLALKKELEFVLEGLNEGLEQSMADSINELSLYDNHPADIGSEVFERSKDLALKDNVQLQLEKVQEALSRIEAGTYGICTHCSRQIPEARLKAVPDSTLCLECRQKEDASDQRFHRSLEEDILSPYYRRSLDVSQAAYDAEDAWQDVARYNKLPHVNYGDLDPQEEDRGYVEEVENIPYKKDEGVIYQDFNGQDDENAPQGYGF